MRNAATELTDKQERFCRKYVETLNACEAYRQAYDCSNMKFTSIARKAAELLENGKVTAYINHLKTNIAEASGITVMRLLSEHCKIAFSDATRVRSGWYTLKEFNELTDDERACIKSVETRQRKMTGPDGETIIEECVKVQVYDKQKALDSIAQMLGYNAPQKIAGEINVHGINVEVIDQDTAERLKRVTGQE